MSSPHWLLCWRCQSSRPIICQPICACAVLRLALRSKHADWLLRIHEQKANECAVLLLASPLAGQSGRPITCQSANEQSSQSFDFSHPNFKQRDKQNAVLNNPCFLDVVASTLENWWTDAFFSYNSEELPEDFKLISTRLPLTIITITHSVSVPNCQCHQCRIANATIHNVLGPLAKPKAAQRKLVSTDITLYQVGCLFKVISGNVTVTFTSDCSRKMAFWCLCLCVRPELTTSSLKQHQDCWGVLYKINFMLYTTFTVYCCIQQHKYQ